MDEVKQRVQKIARILRDSCTVGSVLCKVIMFGAIGLIVILYINNDLVESVGIESRSFLFNALETYGILDGIEKRFVAMIAVFSTFITSLAALFYTNFFKKMMNSIYQGEKPFQREHALQLRTVAWSMLLFMFYNPLLGIMLCLVTMLFSYLFEYGAYLQEKADETNRIQEEMIMSFAEISENKSGQTGQHVRRVAEYSKVLAEELGYDDNMTEYIRLASTMHDIGKLLIPSAILDKPGKLTDEEYTEMKKHTTYGGQMLENVEGEIMGLAKTVALEHHERPDGRGYPEGKDSGEISREGKIVAVADVYDALTSRRSYKEAWDQKEAYNEIVKGSGTQFDETVVEAFKKRYDDINEIRMKFADEQ